MITYDIMVITVGVVATHIPLYSIPEKAKKAREVGCSISFKLFDNILDLSHYLKITIDYCYDDCYDGLITLNMFRYVKAL